MKIKRKDILYAYLIIIIMAPFIPLMWIIEKWDNFWNKEIEVKSK